jgi:predicted kinase
MREKWRERMLIILGGLPGVGKSTLARALSQHLHGTHIRVDTIEQAIRASGMLKAVNPESVRNRSA